MDRLTDAIWGENRPATATKIVQLYVSQWRKEVPDRLVTRAPGYLLEVRQGELDLDEADALAARARGSTPGARAELLREALGLWRGEPLVDVAYEPFAQAAIARIDELRLDLIEQKAETALLLGRHAESIGELEALAAAHPLRERLHGHLMLALYRTGRQADALEVYNNMRKRLVDDLGLEPSPDLQRLQGAILQHHVSLAAPARPWVPLVPAPILRRPRALAAVGALLIVGAATFAGVEVATRGGSPPIVAAPNSVVGVSGGDVALQEGVKVGVRPVAVAVGFGAVWTANADDGTVSRLDLNSKEVAAIGTGADVSDIATGRGAVWVADGNAGTVTRIDPVRRLVEQTISFGRADPLAPQPVFSVAVGAGAVWAIRGSRVVRVDATTGEIVFLPTPPALALAVEPHAVWVTTTDERLLRLDPATGKTTATLPLPGVAASMTFGAGSLWLVVRPPLRPFQLWRVNPRNAHLVGTATTGAYPSAVAYAAGHLWLSDPFTQRVIRFDPTLMRATGGVDVGSWPTDLAVDRGVIWVTLRASS